MNDVVLKTQQEKMEFNIRAKAEMLRYLRSLSWEAKVASIERMNTAGKMAREGMRQALEAEARAREDAGGKGPMDTGVSSEPCDVERLA